jgi:inhibitor of cysteine peptidase
MTKEVAMRALVVLLVALSMLVLGCDDGASPKQVRLTGEDGGTTIEVSVGDEVMIELEANPSTGYGWTHEGGDVAVLAPMGEPEYQSESELPGSGGMMTWLFEARAEGSTKIELAYRRPWETDVEPERWFAVTVEVRA